MTHGEIEAFLAVCEQRNITRASEVLFVGQSTLSTKLKALEKELGCELLIRNKGIREIQLTPEGEQFYALACQYKEIMAQMQSIGRKDDARKLRVASINSLGAHLFPAVYEMFMERYRHIDLEIQDKMTSEAFLTLEKGMTDMAFGTGARNSASIALVPAFSESMMILCSESLGLPGVVGKEDLPMEREIYIQWSLSFGSWHVSAFGSHQRPQIRLELMSQLEFFLKKSSCWSIVPYSVALELSQSPGIRCCQPDFHIPPRVTNCTCRAAEKDSPMIQAFLGCLKDRIEDMRSEHIISLL